MNLSSYEFQVVFCVLVLLGLASVALIVDYLKSMNERLRERHIDFMARHEEMVQRVEQDNTKLLRALAEQSKAFREMNRKSIVVNTIAAGQNPPQITLTPIPEQIAPAQEPDSPVLATGGPVAVADPEPQPEDSLPANVIRIRLKSEDNPVPAAEPNFDTFLEKVVDEFSPAAPDLATLARTVDEFSGRLNVPAGIHPVASLTELLQQKEPFTGLALSIGLNDYLRLEEVHGPTAAAELLNTVDGLMANLAGSDAFITRRADDEFILLFSNLTGAAAQQRLSTISEELWNYQRQTLGTFSAVFSWGAHESTALPLEQALSTAADNMTETRANRNDSGQRHRATA